MRTPTRIIAASLAAVAVGGATAAVAQAAPTKTVKIVHFANCTAMHRVYPHGVGRKGAHDKVRGHTKPVTTFFVNNALYAANRGLDHDHDGVACEKR